jgi:hypothetical protein
MKYQIRWCIFMNWWETGLTLWSATLFFGAGPADSNRALKSQNHRLDEVVSTSSLLLLRNCFWSRRRKAWNDSPEFYNDFKLSMGHRIIDDLRRRSGDNLALSLSLSLSLSLVRTLTALSTNSKACREFRTQSLATVSRFLTNQSTHMRWYASTDEVPNI